MKDNGFFLKEDVEHSVKAQDASIEEILGYEKLTQCEFIFNWKSRTNLRDYLHRASFYSCFIEEGIETQSNKWIPEGVFVMFCSSAVKILI